MYEGVNVGDNDFSALISKMKEAGVEVVYFGGLHTEGGKIVRQMADAGLKAQFISGDGIVSAEFATIAGPAAEGVLNTFGPDPRNNPASADVVKKFRDAGLRARGLHALQLCCDPGGRCRRSKRPARPTTPEASRRQ